MDGAPPCDLSALALKPLVHGRMAEVGIAVALVLPGAPAIDALTSRGRPNPDARDRPAPARAADAERTG